MDGHLSTESLDEVLDYHIIDLTSKFARHSGFPGTLPEVIPLMGEVALKVLILHEDRIVDTAPPRALLFNMRGP